MRLYTLLLSCTLLSKAVWRAQASATNAPPVIPRDPREICETEIFSPKCSNDEVVMVTEAWYGRMELAYCVRMNYGEVGCRADVLEHLDRECSGRRACSLRIPDTNLEASNVCPREFKNYLNVSYDCLPVETAACRSCDRQQYARLTNQRATIASSSTFDSSPSSSCGTSLCPWRIEVPSGQTVNITLVDFSLEQQRASLSHDSCLRYALIREASSARDTPVCGGRRREGQVYASIGNVVEVNVINVIGDVARPRDHFLLRYEAVGCADLDPPENAWSRRTGERTEVGCRDSEQIWETRCVGTRWDGHIGTCPGTIIDRPLTGVPLGNWRVLVAIVLGIALVIGVLIVTVGVVCLRRHRAEQLRRPETTLYVRADDGQIYELPPLTPSHRAPPKDTPRGTLKPRQGSQRGDAGGGGGGGPPPGRENLYAHGRMDSRPLPSIPCEAGRAGTPRRLPDTTAGFPAGGAIPPGGFSPTGAGAPGAPCPYHTQVSVQRTGRPGPQVPVKPVRSGSSLTGRLTGPLTGNASPVTVAQCNIPAPQLYTVLDPSEVQPFSPPGGGPGGSSAPRPSSPPLPPWPGVAGAAPPSSTDLSSAASIGCRSSQRSLPLRGGGEEAGGSGGDDRGAGGCGSPNSEEGHASRQEIALRPTRDGSQARIDSASAGGGSGNSSWP